MAPKNSGIYKERSKKNGSSKDIDDVNFITKLFGAIGAMAARAQKSAALAINETLHSEGQPA